MESTELMKYEQLFNTIETLVLHHSPSGMENQINQFLMSKLQDLGLDAWQDEADNIIAKIPGHNTQQSIAITAHKDEIGAIVKTIKSEGRVEVRRLGGAYPWVYGEGVIDLLGDHQIISGILCFGSRHVSHESPQSALQNDAPLRWEDAWIETKLSVEDLKIAGVRPGTRMVVGKHRKKPLRIQNYIASYTLDNKASIAILLTLAEAIKQPKANVYLVFSSKEEMGAVGALYFTQHQRLDALIALEICPLSVEYPVEDGVAPVLISQDGHGLYDETLNTLIKRTAESKRIPLQLAAITHFGSDASISMKNGHVPRAACLSFPTQNTHGYEIAHLGAILHCIELLQAFIENTILT